MLKRICLAMLCAFVAISAAFAASPDTDTISLLGPDEGGIRLWFGHNTSLSFSGREYGNEKDGDLDYRMYWADFGHRLTNGVSLRGTYMMQELAEWNMPDLGSGLGTDSPTAWKVALDFSQEKLRFTSLWVEYAQLDAGFYLPPEQRAVRAFGSPLSGGGKNFYFPEDTSVWYLAARQQWSRQFSTFQRYAQYSEEGPLSVRQWSLGFGYQYASGLYFEVSYDDQLGALDTQDVDYENKQVHLKTMISF